MPLPSLEKIVPQFDIVIPSTNESLKFRPFLVKEEKILLIALEGKEEKAMLDAIVQVITACALSPIKVDMLSNFDLEYIFLQLRARSVDDVADLSYRCHNQIPLSKEDIEKRFRGRQVTERLDQLALGEQVTGSCDNVVKIRVKLDEVTVQTNPDHKKTIFLTDTMGVNMRYPNFKMAKQMIGKEPTSTIVDALQSISMCVESVFDDASVYTQFSPKEMTEWIEKLTQPQFLKLQQFFETIPKLAHDVAFDCKKCGYQETLHLEGLQTFFG